MVLPGRAALEPRSAGPSLRRLRIPSSVVRLLLIGAPGAGKGTQATRIAEHFHVAHISSGDLLREHVANGTEIGRKAQEYMERGDLVPDDLVLTMLRKPVTEAAASPPAIGGRAVTVLRSWRSTTAIPAVPARKLTDINANRPNRCQKLERWSWKLDSAADTISWPWLVTSMKMKARIGIRTT